MILRPTAGFMLSHPAHFFALGFGTGLAPAAPGTAGTLLAFPLYYALLKVTSPFGVMLLVPFLFLFGVWACERTGKAMGVADHSSMVWDEIVAFLLILAFTPDGLYWQLFAFFAFRTFDVLKPPPIRAAERRWKGGFGVMFDDILAAFYALLLMAVAAKLLL
jgi:phosphatidylglycerophosphatase A